MKTFLAGSVWVMAALSGCTCGSIAVPRAEASPPSSATSTPVAAKPPMRTPDVIFVPTPQERVDAMLRLANLKAGQKHYDLGCGDGRIAITAAKVYGTRSVCIDIDPVRIEEATRNVKAAGVEHLVEVRQADLFETDFSDADAITLYLLPELNRKLRPKLQRMLRPGARVVSHSFDMGEWKPDRTMDVSGGTIYLWTIRK